MSVKNQLERGRILLKASWDSKSPLDPLVSRSLFSFLIAHDGDGEEVDPNDLVGRKFQVVGADDKRMYLEELRPRKVT